MPTPWIGWHLAGDGHSVEPGEQIRAQLVGEEEPAFSRAHSAWALDPEGAAGQGVVGEQDGEQKAPGTPSMETFCSLEPQEEVYGSS
eukprot:CAMPEP_0197447994 /NCGR_PEP_ID=MMETSP1175-20131217/15622_1 /TAXON_ID=1003142 /ORGANISM="Triceratium dubium, Strain CCMP147" /LENGTH=86 /DNA_ID=CAMNT_0042979581 /DNA_START=282 /DNA_END=542 /DNA_ORIENTATION=+